MVTLPDGLLAWLGVIAGIVVGLIALRALVLWVLGLGVDWYVRRIVEKQSMILLQRPPGFGDPLFNYLAGFRIGTASWVPGAVRQFTSHAPYKQLVMAEGIGLAVRLRQTLLLGLIGGKSLQKLLPHTVYIGTGSYYAMRDVVLRRAPERDLPADIIDGAREPFEAFFRIEAYFFMTIQFHFNYHDRDFTAKLMSRLGRLAGSDPRPGAGVAAAHGFGRGATFVAHSHNELTALLAELPPHLAPYGRVGAGVSRLNSSVERIELLGEGVRAFPEPERPDVVAGAAFILGFAANYLGPVWLHGFKNLTPSQERTLRTLEADALQMIWNHGEFENMPSIHSLFDDLRTMAGGHVDAIMGLSTAVVPPTDTGTAAAAR